ncbi:uncharacterized protein PFLUO_LOCUS2792 [Penicillium psychrofluorescens]|uniref:uncharacterized protein n=1 Tax=Penicillium psychrofluorescens TaxID=3158075 RepID=UPI003CCCCEC2
MRFRTQLVNPLTFSKLTASLASLGKVCWMRLEYDVIRFTIIPDQGTQVWAQIPIDAIFDETTYELESNSDAINIEINVSVLHRALRSAVGSTSAQFRLTKKGKTPLLALTVLSAQFTPGNMTLSTTDGGPVAEDAQQLPPTANRDVVGDMGAREREVWITQEVPIKILHEAVVDGLHEPHCPDPDVHIILPSLQQLKSVSDRFTKLAASDSKNTRPSVLAPEAPGLSAASFSENGGSGGSGGTALSTNSSPKLELSANMHGKLKLSIVTDELRLSSVWSGLVNPELDPAQMSQTAYSQLPSERNRAAKDDGESGWATVRIDGRDWGRVLSVGRLSPKVVACFINEMALVLYVYLPGRRNREDSCLTYYINSFAL